MKDQITQFQIALIELNRHISYKKTDQAISSYNKLNEMYQNILNSDSTEEEKHYVYYILTSAHNNLTTTKTNFHLKIPEIVISSFFIFSAIILHLLNPTITGMLIAKQQPVMASGVLFIPLVLIIIPIAIIIRNIIKK
ncbi:hypothetical protein ISS04_02055 [Candidatus Woesearchaeota archaeon]|nr:hypothetical protein [Candidatus Woesearchaeota archaeon]